MYSLTTLAQALMKISTEGGPSVGGHQDRSAFLLDEHDEELRRFRLACVPPDDVNIIGTLVEALTRFQSHFLSPFHLHHDRAFQHVDEPVCIVAMDGVRTAGRILHGDHQPLFVAWKVCQVSRHDLGNLGLLALGLLALGLLDPQRTHCETRQDDDSLCERHELSSRLSDAISMASC